MSDERQELRTEKLHKIKNFMFLSIRKAEIKDRVRGQAVLAEHSGFKKLKLVIG
jgi:hypothetical protein